MKKIERQINYLINNWLDCDLQDLKIESGDHKFEFVFDDVRKCYGEEYLFNKLVLTGIYYIEAAMYEDEIPFITYVGCDNNFIYADGKLIDCEPCRVSLRNQIDTYLSNTSLR